jgi:hypothetical protein
VTEPTKHELYDIWEMDEAMRGFLFAAQLPNSVMFFATRERAEQYIAAVKIERKKQGLKETVVSR